MNPFPSARRRRVRTHSIEILEARIAPATLVSLNSGNQMLTVQGDYVDDGSATVQAGAPETLSFSVNGGNLLITDATHHVTASSPGVTQSGANQVSIPIGSLTGDFSIETGTGADSLTFNNSLALAAGHSLTSHTSGTITFASGGSLFTTGTGSINLVASKNLVLSPGALLSTVNGGITLQGNPANVAQGAAFGIDVNGASITTSGAGNLALTGFGLLGVELRGGAILGSSGTGTIGVAGTAEGGGLQHGVEIAGAGTRITSATGDITVQGQGGTGQDGNIGLYVHTGAVVSSTGTARINLNGTGGAGGQFNYGVALEDSGTLVTSLHGDVVITGLGGQGSLSTNAGISILRGAQVTSTSLAKLALSGIGGTGSDGNYGIVIGDNGIASAGLTSANGDISLTGTSTDTTGVQQDGVRFEGSTAALKGFLTTTGTANVTLNGTGGNATGFGIDLTGTSTLSFNGAANSLIADSTNINNLATIAAAGKTVTLRAKAIATAIDLGGTDAPGKLGLTSAELNRITAGTVQIGDSSSGPIIVSAPISRADATNLTLATGADLTVSASFSKTAGASANYTFQAAGDIIFDSAADVTSTSGTLNVVLDSNRDESGSGRIRLNTNTVIDSNGGSITLGGGLDPLTTPAIGTAGGTNNYGVHLTGSQLLSGAGAISVRGQGGSTAGGQNNFGVRLASTLLQTSSGGITIFGAGGTGSLENHVGVSIESGSDVVSTGSGAITVTGIAGPGSSRGISVEDASTTIDAQGTGALSLFGTGGSGAGEIGGFSMKNGGAILAGGGASILIEVDSVAGADSFVLQGTAGTISGTGALTIRPAQNATTIGLGGASGVLNLDAIDLGKLADGFSSITIGRAAGAGAITANAFIFNDPLTLQNPGGGGITLNGAVTANDHFTLTTGGGIVVNSSITFGGNLLMTAGGVDQSILVKGVLTKSSGGNAMAFLKATGDVRFENSADLMASAGALALTLNSDSDGNGVGGVLVDNNSGITTNGGNLIIGGGATPGTTPTGYLIGGAKINSGVSLRGDPINTGAGDMSIRGRSRDGAFTFVIGVDIVAVLTTTTGNVTIVGTGGVNNGNSIGVQVSGTTFHSSGGAFSLTGVGQSVNSAGVSLSSATIGTIGTGTITIQGTGATAGGTTNNGISISGGSSVVVGGSGAITLNGTAGAASSGVRVDFAPNNLIGFNGNVGYSGNIAINADSVSLANHSISTTGAVTFLPTTAGTAISLGGSAPLDLTDAELAGITAATIQIGNSSSGAITVDSALTPANNLSLTTGSGVTFNQGVTMAADKNLTVNALGISDGTILINAALAASGAGAISLTTVRDTVATQGSSISVVDGALTLSANAGGATVGDFVGINLTGTTLTTSGAGPISLTGRGGVSTTASSLYGISLQGDAVIESTRDGATAGGISVTATAGGGGATGSNYGIELGGFQQTGTNHTRITSVSGAILVTGSGGAGTGAGEVGIDIRDGGQVISTGTGATAATITLIGMGSASDGGNAGISMSSTDGTYVFGSAVTSVDGAISLTGTGGAGGGYSAGILMGQGSRVAASGTGSVSLTGTGATGTGPGLEGVLIAGAHANGQASQVTAADGALMITGTAADPAYSGISILGPAFVSTSGAGDVTLIADGMNLMGGVSAAGTVLLHPKTAGTAIDLGGVDAPGVLGLTDAELAQVTAGTVQIGDSASGPLSVSAPISHLNTNALVFTAGTGLNINLGANVTTARGPVTFSNHVVLTGSSVVDTINGGAGFPGADVTFLGAIDADAAANTRDLTITAGSKTVMLGGGIGLVQKNDALTIIAGHLGGALPTTHLDGDLRIAINTLLTTGDITAGGMVTLISNDAGLAVAGTLLTTAGDVTLIGDSLILGGTITANATTGTVTLKQSNPGTSIDLGTGGSVGTLGLTNADLNQITAGTVQIGDSDSGAITVSAALTVATNLSLTTGAGITFNAAVTMAVNKSFTASALSASTGTIGFTTANADLSATGTGAIALTTARDLVMAAGSSISVVDGALTLHANLACTATGNLAGIYLTGATVASTGSGPVSLSGHGGDTGNGNQGVLLGGGSSIMIGTLGSLNILGTGGPGDGFLNNGVALSGVDKIISLGANITITGFGGGAGTSDTNYGVGNNGQIEVGGAGVISITGTGGVGTGGFNFGVLVGGSVKSQSGGVTLVGTGGAGISSDGIATGGNGMISAGSGGNLMLTGTAGNSGAGNVGINVRGGGSGMVTTAAGGGNVTLVGDSITLAAPVSVDSSHTVTLRQLTNGTAIDLGGVDGAGTLGLANGDLAFVTAGTLRIGDANSGPVTFSAAVSQATSGAIVITSGGNIVFNPGSFNTNGVPLTLTPGAAGSVQPITSGVEVAASSLAFGAGAKLGIAIDGTTLDTQYRQLNVAGAVKLTGVDLVLSGAHVPVPGESFTIVQNDGSDAIVGTFNGLAQGAAIPNFLGSGLTAKISYNGGSGNDVVIFLPTGIDETGVSLVSGNLAITDINGGTTDDTLTVSLSGANVRVFDPMNQLLAGAGATQVDPNTVTVPLASITGHIQVATMGGSDTLTLSLAGGDFIGLGGLSFDGGGGGTDALIIAGGNQGTVTYNFTNANSGSVVMSAHGTVTFTGLEAIRSTDPGSATVFNLPAGPNAATLADDGTMSNSLSRLSGSTFPQTDFYTLAGKLTINRGNAGDTLTVGALPDFGADLTVGAPASPLDSIVFTSSLMGEPQLNLAATNFTVGAGVSVIGGGTLTIGAGAIGGHLGGDLGLTKVGPGALLLASDNVYKGETLIQGGTITLGDTDAAQNSTVRLAVDNGLHFAGSIGTFVVGGLAGANKLALADDASSPVTLRAGNNDSNTTYSGVLSGAGDLVKIGTATLTLTGANDHHATFLENGSLQVSRDAALGHTGSALTLRGGTLHATATFSTTRPIMLESGTGTFEASAGKTLTLAGLISGQGDLAIGPVGKVAITNSGNTNSGTTQLDSDYTTVVNGVTISTPHATGAVIVTPTPGVANSIDKIEIAGTNTKTSLTVNGPKNTPITVARIVSNGLTEITAITLGKNVTLGQSLVVAGKVGSVTLSDVSAHALIQLGKGLAYSDTYKNKPNLTLHDVLGSGVVIDVAGDGVSGLLGGIGGGGLGRIVVNKWDAPGLIKTTQSITSFTVKSGNSQVSIEVDPNHLGTLTTGNVGLVSIPTGQWAGASMQVEGVVAQFLTKGLAVGSTISAGAFGTVNIKGNYAGSILATYNATVGTPLPGNKIKVTATGAIGNVTIVGDFSGVISGDGKVGNVTLSGTANFRGTLRGGSLGNISAASFTGTGAIVGDPRHTITAIGSMGNITAKVGGLTDYIIAAGTDLGSDALFGGVADLFTSYYSTATHVKTAVSIGTVTSKGPVEGTTIAAGVDPGLDGYGDNDALVALPAEVTKTKVKIGALKFDTAAPTLAFTNSPLFTVTNAFEAPNLTSVQLGTVKITKFTPTQYIDSGSGSIIVRLLT